MLHLFLNLACTNGGKYELGRDANGQDSFTDSLVNAQALPRLFGFYGHELPISITNTSNSVAYVNQLKNQLLALAA